MYLPTANCQLPTSQVQRQRLCVRMDHFHVRLQLDTVHGIFLAANSISTDYGKKRCHSPILRMAYPARLVRVFFPSDPKAMRRDGNAEKASLPPSCRPSKDPSRPDDRVRHVMITTNRRRIRLHLVRLRCNDHFSAYAAGVFWHFR